MTLWQNGAAGGREVKMLIINVLFLALIWSFCQMYLYKRQDTNIDAVPESFNILRLGLLKLL